MYPRSLQELFREYQIFFCGRAGAIVKSRACFRRHPPLDISRAVGHVKRMYYIESPSVDPHFNLALEQYVFDRLAHLERGHAWFMLWRNDKAIIVGKHQNTGAEIDAAFARERGISVVRRLSGGGAVYHDLGNVNFTFIADHAAKGRGARDGAAAGGFDFSLFCLPVIRALESFGVRAELSGRNDMTIEGRKFSGNAQYVKRGRVMHHGTIMYDSDLETLAGALRVSGDKIASKGLASVRSRVTNVKPHMREDVGVEAFMQALRRHMSEHNDLREYALGREDLAAVGELRKQVYDTWEWNYGRSPACSIHKQRRFEGCGSIELFLDVDKGIIRACHFRGDFFGNGEPDALGRVLEGVRHEEGALRQVLEGVRLEHYFFNLDREDFIRLLVE